MRQIIISMFTFILVLSNSSWTYSKPVSEEMVNQIGVNFTIAQNSVVNRNKNIFDESSVLGIREIFDDESGILLAYVVDLWPKGFIVVAPDTEITPNHCLFIR